VTATFSFSSETLAYRTDFHIAGAHCLLSTNSPEALRSISRWRSPGSTQNGNFFEMEILVNSIAGESNDPSPHFRGLRHLVFVFLPGRCFLCYDLLRKRVHGAVTSTVAGDATFWDSLLLPITIGILGATMGIAPLHCACLDRDGSAVLIAGVSGAGKSTLAAALAQRALALVSDDWTYMSRQGSSLVARGLFAPIKLLPDSARFFPCLSALSPRKTLNGELAYEFDPRAILSCAVRDSSRPRWLLFLERGTAGGCQFIPCRPEYVRDFFERNAEKLPDELRAATVARSQIIRQLSQHPAWILQTNKNPQQTAQAIDEFLREERYATA
jgi:hypothetical protein